MGRNKPIILGAIAALAAVVVIYYAAVHAAQPRVTVDFFGVGQGDSMLVSAGSSQLLIDAGPDRTVLSRLGRAMPFFDRVIEQVIITHPHADHYLGLAAVLERYRVRRILLPAVRSDPPEFASLIGKFRAAGTEIIGVGAGDRLRFGGAELEVLWPELSAAAPPGAADSAAVNGLSLVMRLTVFCGGLGEPDTSSPGCGAALFTGDATAATEDAILSAAVPLEARVLKVGHHGSNHSTSAAWLRAVRPELAVIEVGRNSFGHPAPALLRRLQAAGIRVWRTDQDGELRAVFIRAGAGKPAGPFTWRLE